MAFFREFVSWLYQSALCKKYLMICLLLLEFSICSIIDPEKATVRTQSNSFHRFGIHINDSFLQEVTEDENETVELEESSEEFHSNLSIPSYDVKVIDLPVCNDINCVKAAADLLKTMDSKVSPCYDFYQFTCGKFLNEMEFLVPRFKSSISQLDVLNDRLLKRIHELLLKTPSRDRKQRFIADVKLYYERCLDENSMKDNLESIIGFIFKLGGWPILGQTSTTRFHWGNYTKKFREGGVSVDQFLTFSVETRSNKHMLHISSAKLSLPSSILRLGRNIKIVNTYYEYALGVALLLGAKIEAATQIEYVMKLETQLAQIVYESQDAEKNRNYFVEMSIKDMNTNFTCVNWIDVVKNLAMAFDEITEKHSLVIKYPTYVKKLCKILRSTTSTVLNNYVIWRAISKHGLIISPEIREIYHAHFYNQKNIVEKLDGFLDGILIELENRPRWIDCIEAVYRAYPMEMNYLYVNHFFHEDDKKEVFYIIKNIKKGIKRLIKNKLSTLMTPKTMNSAYQKIDEITMCIGYQDNLLDVEKLNSGHIEVASKAMKFVRWYITINKLELERRFSQLFTSVLPCEELLPLGDHFEYRYDRNDLILSARYLHYNRKLPFYLNLGNIGFQMAQLILRSVLHPGNKYTNDERITQNFSWWDSEDIRKIDPKLQCFFDDYDDFSSYNHSNAITHTLAIDSVALEVIYDLIKKWFGIHSKSVEVLPGFRYFPNEMFWIFYGSSICTYERMVTEAEIRLNIGLRNNKRFPIDLDCEDNSRMNPTQKCSLLK